MRMRRARQSQDELDDRCWSTVSEMVVAAHDNDFPRFVAWSRRIGTRSVSGGRCYMYLYHLVHEAVWARFGRVPDEAEVLALTADLYPRWAERLTSGSEELLTTLKIAATLIHGKQAGDYATDINALSVTLGLLLDKPQEQLRRLRPQVAEHWSDKPWLQNVGR